MCCSESKVSLALLKEPPQPLKGLLVGDDSSPKNSMSSLQKFNSAFLMTSFGTDHEIRGSSFSPTKFKDRFIIQLVLSFR